MRLSLYKVNQEFTEYLRDKEPKVPNNSDIKQNRPFLGIITEINCIKYYAPLTSPKPKHITMKNNLDFIKINGGKWGAININNMIPVVDECVKKINISEFNIASDADKKYKQLLINQITWCNSNKELIYKKANKLYDLIASNKLHNHLTQRCCNFKLLEKMCEEYKLINYKKEKINNKYVMNEKKFEISNYSHTVNDFNFKNNNLKETVKNANQSKNNYDIDY